MNSFFEKYRDMSVQAKSAIWFAVCSILQKGISFITVPIFTRLLTTEQYGTYSLYLSWFQILTIITSLYLYHGVFNNGMTKFKFDRDTYIASMQGLTLCITSSIFIIYLLAYRFWSDLLGLAPILMMYMFIEMIVTPSFHFWAGKQRFEFKYVHLVVLTIAKSIVNPLLGMVMVITSQKKDVARISSVVLTELVFCGTIMILQYYRGRCFFNMKYWRYALRLAIPLLPHYLSGMILNQGDRIMIDKMVGKSEVAFYSVAYSIGLLVQIFTHAINNSFIPWMYLKINSNDIDDIKKTTNILLVIVAFISLGLMMCSPEIILIFGSDKYASAAYVIPPVAASVFFIFLYNLLAIPQFYFEATRFLATSSIIAAIINVALNYIFINEYGFIAAGYTTLACYVLYSLGHYIVSKRVLRNFMDGNLLYDRNFIAALSSFVVLSCIISNFLYSYWILRYVLIGFIVLVGYVKRNLLLNLIKGLR